MTQPKMPVTDPAEDLKELLSTILDLAAVLAVGGGISWGLFSVLGPYAVAIGGVIVIVLNALAGLMRRPEPEPEPEPEKAPASPPPGPEDEGNLHVSGR